MVAAAWYQQKKFLLRPDAVFSFSYRKHALTKPSNCAQSQTLVPLLEVAQTAPHTQAVAPHTQAVTLKIPDPLQLHSTALHVAGERQAELNALIAKNEKVYGP